MNSFSALFNPRKYIVIEIVIIEIMVVVISRWIPLSINRCESSGSAVAMIDTVRTLNNTWLIKSFGGSFNSPFAIRRREYRQIISMQIETMYVMIAGLPK